MFVTTLPWKDRVKFNFASVKTDIETDIDMILKEDFATTLKFEFTNPYSPLGSTMINMVTSTLTFTLADKCSGCDIWNL